MKLIDQLTHKELNSIIASIIDVGLEIQVATDSRHPTKEDKVAAIVGVISDKENFKDGYAFVIGEKTYSIHELLEDAEAPTETEEEKIAKDKDKQAAYKKSIEPEKQEPEEAPEFDKPDEEVFNENLESAKQLFEHTLLGLIDDSKKCNGVRRIRRGIVLLNRIRKMIK